MNKLLILAFTLAASFNVAASQNVTVLTNLDGMTLYIFDKDSPNNSHCYDACAASWPPYLVTSADAARPGWGVTMREDGNAQHTFQGKPLYLWVGDQHAGDQTGALCVRARSFGVCCCGVSTEQRPVADG